MGVPQPKSMYGQHMFNPRESRADYVLGSIWLLPLQCFQDFRVLNFLGVPQPLPKHGFLPKFQDMFKSRASRADQVLGSIWLPWQGFYMFGVLKFVSALQATSIHNCSSPE